MIFQNCLKFHSCKILYNNFEISLMVFFPNITTNHAITYTYLLLKIYDHQFCFLVAQRISFICNTPTSTRRYRQGTGNIEKTNDKLLFIHLVKNYHNYFSTPQEENKSRLGEKKKVGISNIKLTNITALAAKVTLI